MTCAQDYYLTCDVYCAPALAEDNFTCERRTGQKVCSAGWMGNDCDIEEATEGTSEERDTDSGADQHDTGEEARQIVLLPTEGLGKAKHELQTRYC